MTRSIFDPTGPDTEHSGSRNMGPSADNNSHMPSSITDGVVSEEEAAEQQQMMNADGLPIDNAASVGSDLGAQEVKADKPA